MNFPTIKQILLGTGLIALVLIVIIWIGSKPPCPFRFPTTPKENISIY